ncbi:MAG: IMPACT family protein [Clostridiales Family XIII bacterium]|nr:IMPACT family protein [Clostridiales Family XIII bacterium]
MIKYYTVRGDGSAELIIEKSRFIGRVRETLSRDAADRFFAEIKKTHRTATHNVPAFVIGDSMQLQWASDDGEPQGTSGAPIVQMLTSEGITNAAVMVTRYFGGIKLGTGGLVRAYTASAKAALDAAGIVAVKEGVAIRYEIGYPYLDKLKALAERSGFSLGDLVYAEKAAVTVTAEKEDAQRLISAVTGLTGGTERLIYRKDCDIRT